MKLLMLSSEFPPIVGGVGSHVHELSRALIAMGNEVTLVTPSHEFETEQQVDGIQVYRPRLIRATPFYDWHLWLWLKTHLKQLKPDIVHIHGMRPLWAGTRFAAGAGAPAVFTNHTSGFLKRLDASRSRQLRTLRRIEPADYIIAPSEELVAAGHTIGYRKPSQFISNGVDDNKFTTTGSNARSQWNIAPDQCVVLMARRLVPKNGVIYFARAAALLKDSPVHLVIAGDGTERDAIEDSLRESGMLERTTFLGAVANEQMPEIYRGADISVLPSLMEATSIAALEAMACGVPVIASDVGGLPALVEHQNTGLLVPPEDPVQLAAAIRQLAGDPELRAAMGKAARDRVEAQFSWSNIARQTCDVYRQLVSKAA